MAMNKYERAQKLVAELNAGIDESAAIFSRISEYLSEEVACNPNGVARKYAKDMLTILTNATARRGIIEKDGDAQTVNA